MEELTEKEIEQMAVKIDEIERLGVTYKVLYMNMKELFDKIMSNWKLVIYPQYMNILALKGVKLLDGEIGFIKINENTYIIALNRE